MVCLHMLYIWLILKYIKAIIYTTFQVYNCICISTNPLVLLLSCYKINKRVKRASKLKCLQCRMKQHFFFVEKWSMEIINSTKFFSKYVCHVCILEIDNNTNLNGKKWHHFSWYVCILIFICLPLSVFQST